MIDVAFAPNDVVAADVAGRAMVVIDVLRATTTICTAMAHGARAVIPAADPGDATRLAEALDRREVLLTGERNLEPIPGFQAGNSPREMTPELVAGKTLVMTTTNGTRALLATVGAEQVVLASGVNLTAAGDAARAMLEETGRLLVLCGGRDTGFGLDDAYIAGRIVIAALGGRRTRKGLNDSAIAAVDIVRRYGGRIDRVFALSSAGRALAHLGHRDDVAYCAEVDRHPVVPRFHDRRVTLARPTQEVARG
jgi:2-phosphosulfolactate phosphatase